jgi:hypothetical protein
MMNDLHYSEIGNLERRNITARGRIGRSQLIALTIRNGSKTEKSQQENLPHTMRWELAKRDAARVRSQPHIF